MNYFLLSINPSIKPVYFVVAVMIVLFMTAITRHFQCQNRITKAQSIALILLTTYLFLVFASTVFSRTPDDYYSYELIPFWSYRAIGQGSIGLLWEDIFNILMLLPMGILMPIFLKENRGKQAFGRVVLMGFLLSLTIEILQLVTKRGMFEFDDLFHNTLGVAIGCWIWWKVKNRFKT
jgi:glycopeptide antibiotics resistance protein